MIGLKFLRWKEQFDRIGRMPCPHEYCERITSLDAEVYSMTQWNIDRRIHNMLNHG